MAIKKEEIERDIDGVISTITGFSPERDEDRENMELCRRYALSNVYYHRFLDTSGHEVRRMMEGAVHKLQVHALHDRAHRLHRLWSQFVADAPWGAHKQYDIEWRLLSLLLHLSRRPSALEQRLTQAADVSRLSAAADPSTAADVDWTQELRVHQQHALSSPSESEQSDWSDSEEELPEIVTTKAASTSPPSKWLHVDTGVESYGRSEVQYDVDASRQWLRDNVVEPYSVVVPSVPAGVQLDAAQMLDRYRRQLGLFSDRDVTALSEWCVCRELVWQLLCPGESPMIALDSTAADRHCFTPSGRFSIHGVTQKCLSSVLSRWCGAISAVSRLRAIRLHPDLPRLAVYRAFCAAVGQQLRRLDEQLLLLDRQLVRQDETVTLLAVDARLSCWLSLLQMLDLVYRRGIAEMDPQQPAWIKSARLVSVLYAQTESCGVGQWAGMFYSMLIDTLQPLLDVASRWISSDADPDPSGELPIRRSADVDIQDVDYWTRGFLVLCDQRDWWQDDVEPLPFLLPQIANIVETAKCLRILSHLRCDDVEDDCDLACELRRSLLLKPVDPAVAETAISLPPADSTADEASCHAPVSMHCDRPLRSGSVELGRGDVAVRPSPAAGVSAAAGDALPAADHRPLLVETVLRGEGDAQLTAAFSEVVEALREESAPCRPGSLHSQSSISQLQQVASGDYSGLLGAHRSLSDCLRSTVSVRCVSVCRRLVAVLFDQHRLLHHLRIIRRVFLHEADDIMTQFARHVLDRDCPPPWETRTAAAGDDDGCSLSVDLTLCLEACVATRFPDAAARLSVTDSVHLQYAAPWPVSLVLTPVSSRLYNTMFLFIMRVKHALRQLQSLHFRELYGKLTVYSLDVVSLDSPSCVVHRLQLLRAWLLHFVITIHSHVMMRVLHSTWIELESQLLQCRDVGSIIQVHERYVSLLSERCLLGGGTERRLREAVQRVLQLCDQLVRLWRHHRQLPALQRVSKLEADYAHLHYFLVLFLQQYRHQLPHLEALAVALAQSSPCQVPLEDVI